MPAGMDASFDFGRLDLEMWSEAVPPGSGTKDGACHIGNPAPGMVPATSGSGIKEEVLPHASLF